MKVWNLISDNDSGFVVSTYAAEADARAAFAYLARLAWQEEFGESRPWPEGDAEDAYCILLDRPGFMDFLSVRETVVVPAQNGGA